MDILKLFIIPSIITTNTAITAIIIIVIIFIMMIFKFIIIINIITTTITVPGDVSLKAYLVYSVQRWESLDKLPNLEGRAIALY